MPDDSQATTVFRFQIWVIPDKKGVAIFTPSMLGGVDKITEALKKAAVAFDGATVDPAKPVMRTVEDTGAQVTYDFGTGGAVRFSSPQSQDTLHPLQSAIADALVDGGFGIFPPVTSKMEGPAITDVERLQAFFRYCDELEKHPFFAAHSAGGTFRLDVSFPAEGADIAEVNFDRFHLESLLGRLRQFLSSGDLFFFKLIRRAIVGAFGEAAEFNQFYSKFIEVLRRPFPSRSIKFLKANEEPVVEGATFTELLEAQLYTGPIHSERILRPRPGSAEEHLPESHEATKKKLVLDLGYSAMKCVENIFAFRSWILRRARESGRIDLFPELEAFDERCRAAGV